VNRPKRIYSNLAISLDGKISSYSRPGTRFASAEDRKRMEELRADADAVLIGGGTNREDSNPLSVKDAEKQPLNVVMTSSLNIPFPTKFFQNEDTKKLIYTTENYDQQKFKKISPYAEIVVFKGDSVDPASVVNDLAEKNINSLLIEGGGAIMFSFLKAKLIDEMFVTLCPTIFGGKDAPTLVEGEGFLPEDAPSLELIEQKTVGNEIFLHYKLK